MDGVKLIREPLKVTGQVKLISNGIYRNRGPASPGMLVDMGPTALTR
jgi:hypothetical protein